jgi:hypothetical protein
MFEKSSLRCFIVRKFSVAYTIFENKYSKSELSGLDAILVSTKLVSDSATEEKLSKKEITIRANLLTIKKAAYTLLR